MARAVDNIIMKAFKRKSFDNVTVVMIAFKNLEIAVEREFRKKGRVVKKKSVVTEANENLKKASESYGF